MYTTIEPPETGYEYLNQLRYTPANPRMPPSATAAAAKFS
jgi:hypothetical protein